MKIILTQDITALGKEGSVVKVKDGYARNFLLPKRLAFEATAGNLKRIESMRAKKAGLEEQSRKEAQGLADKLSKVSCTVTAEVNDRDKLYGAITPADIAKALEVEGFPVDKKTIILDQPIEELGIYEVGIKLHHDVTAKVRVWVAKK